jgi:hypothetical protein
VNQKSAYFEKKRRTCGKAITPYQTPANKMPIASIRSKTKTKKIGFNSRGKKLADF